MNLTIIPFSVLLNDDTLGAETYVIPAPAVKYEPTTLPLMDLTVYLYFLPLSRLLSKYVFTPVLVARYTHIFFASSYLYMRYESAPGTALYDTITPPADELASFTCGAARYLMLNPFKSAAPYVLTLFTL